MPRWSNRVILTQPELETWNGHRIPLMMSIGDLSIKSKEHYRNIIIYLKKKKTYGPDDEHRIILKNDERIRTFMYGHTCHLDH